MEQDFVDTKLGRPPFASEDRELNGENPLAGSAGERMRASPSSENTEWAVAGGRHAARDVEPLATHVDSCQHARDVEPLATYADSYQHVRDEGPWATHADSYQHVGASLALEDNNRQ